MKNIIEEIYAGRLFPTEMLMPKQPEYDELTKKISESEKLWREKLSAEDFKQLDELMEMRCEAGFNEANTAFAHGFKMGSMIMMEVFRGADDLFKT